MPTHCTCNLSHISHAATGINASTHPLLSISLFRFLTGEESLEHDRYENSWIHHAATDLWTNKTRGSLNSAYVRDTHGRFDGEPTVRRPGSSTAPEHASTASTRPRRTRSIQKISHHSFYVIGADCWLKRAKVAGVSLGQLLLQSSEVK